MPGPCEDTPIEIPWRCCLFVCFSGVVVVAQVEDAAEKSERRAAIALQLKEGLLRLGPTFIKLGQLLSTRWAYGSLLSLLMGSNSLM